MQGLKRAALAALAVAAIAIAVAALSAGCVVDGPKVIEGTDLSIGISLPGTEGIYELTFLNYLSGFKCVADEHSRVKLRYTCAESNNYFSVVHTQSAKTVDAEIEPLAEPDDDDEEEEEKKDGEAESKEG